MKTPYIRVKHRDRDRYGEGFNYTVEFVSAQDVHETHPIIAGVIDTMHMYGPLPDRYDREACEARIGYRLMPLNDGVPRYGGAEWVGEKERKMWREWEQMCEEMFKP